MRVRLIIEDEEYRNAFIESISLHDIDVYVEVGSVSSIKDIGKETLILTDLPPQRFDYSVIKDYLKRVVFLTNNPGDAYRNDIKGKCQKIFKYSGIGNIFADLEQIKYMWIGDREKIYGLKTKVFSVCSDKSDDIAELCIALARQIIFRKGGSVLVISLKYINEYGGKNETDRSRFARLMYYLDIGREYPTDSFIYKDNYGISYLRLSKGMNPMAYYTSNELFRIIRDITANKFDAVILDVGNSFSEANIRIINKSDSVIYFCNDSLQFDINEIYIEADMPEKVKIIQIGKAVNDLNLEIDDYVMEVYRIRENEDYDEKNDNKKVFTRN